MSVRHDNVRIVRFNLSAFSKEEAIDSRRTMSSVSHRVPLPFLNTSSGFKGIMLHSEKMNGWTYFM